MPEIFISYSSRDREPALSLVEDLRGLGYDAWLDKDMILGASDWSTEIVKAINEAFVVLFLVSKESVASHNCAKEVRLASEKQKPILPVVLEAVDLPVTFEYQLSGLQHLHFGDTAALKRSLTALDKRPRAEIALAAGGDIISGPKVLEDSKVVRLAVLPFDDLSPAHDNEWFSDGMTDELISTLGSIERMHVASRNEVYAFKNKRAQGVSVAKALDVRYLIEGSVRKAGEKIRITASISDTQSQSQIWVKNYNGSFDDVFAFQESVATEVVKALELSLKPQEREKVSKHGTGSSDAYEFYLRGIAAQRCYTKEGYNEAIRWYDRAIAADEEYVDAYFTKAQVHVGMYREYSKDPKWLRSARECLAIAQNKSGETVRTLWLAGQIAWQEENYEEAEDKLRSAIELDPKDNPSHNALGNLFMSLGRYQDAAKQFCQLLLTDRTLETYGNALTALSAAGDMKQAEELAMSALEQLADKPPRSVSEQIQLAYLYYWSNQGIRASELLDEIFTSNNLDAMQLFNLGALADNLGQEDRALKLYKLSIRSGYRDIGLLRRITFLNPENQKEFMELVQDLTETVRNDHAK